MLHVFMKIQPYQDEKGEYRWRAVAGNNRIIANSGEGYKTKRGLYIAINRFLNTTFYMEE